MGWTQSECYIPTCDECGADDAADFIPHYPAPDISLVMEWSERPDGGLLCEGCTWSASKRGADEECDDCCDCASDLDCEECEACS